MDTRALAAYLPTVVRSSDRAGAITLREDPVLGDVLVIADGESGYATHLYRFEGMLMEDYARIGAALSPERAQRIAATARFEVKLTNKLIVVETDAGRVLIHPRSGGETA